MLRRDVRKPQLTPSAVAGSGGPPRISRQLDGFPDKYGPYLPLLGLHPLAQKTDPTRAKHLLLAGATDQAVSSLRSWWNRHPDPLLAVEAVWGPQRSPEFDGIIERFLLPPEMGEIRAVEQEGREIVIVAEETGRTIRIRTAAEELATRLVGHLRRISIDPRAPFVGKLIEEWLKQELLPDRLTRRKLFEWTCPPDSGWLTAKEFSAESTAVVVRLEGPDARLEARVECHDPDIARECCAMLRSRGTRRRLENVQALADVWESRLP